MCWRHIDTCVRGLGYQMHHLGCARRLTSWRVSRHIKLRLNNDLILWRWRLRYTSDAINGRHIQDVLTTCILFHIQNFVLWLQGLVSRRLLRYYDLSNSRWGCLSPRAFLNRNFLLMDLFFNYGTCDFLGSIIMILLVFKILVSWDRHSWDLNAKLRASTWISRWSFRLSQMWKICGVFFGCTFCLLDSKPHVRLFDPRVHEATAVHLSGRLLISRISEIRPFDVISAANWCRPNEPV